MYGMLRMMKRSLLVCFIFSMLLVSACSQQSVGDETVLVDNGNAITNTVTITNFVFDPQELVVDVGASVLWKHNDNAAHTLVSQGLFKSEVMSRGDEFRFTFSEKGEYPYYCSIHPSMTGKIIVR